VKILLLLIVLEVTMYLGPALVRAQSRDGLTESPDGPEAVKVYYTEEEALGKVFAKADTLWSEEWRPTSREKEELESRLAWRIEEESFLIHRGVRKEEELGYAMIMEEKGRFKPITFIVKIGPDFEVEMVLVMVYRESRGDGVKRQRFLKQFRGKDAADHLQLNRDIVGVSGATMSSRALALGVKKALAIVSYRYPSTGDDNDR
jgi:hypothetical protein